VRVEKLCAKAVETFSGITTKVADFKALPLFPSRLREINVPPR
jgi:hypothetical protein